ncbi:MAG: MFS transporter [Rickettsiaceae bacterium]|jgi:MHS family proline/betaine transporter-like MFS transporter|nr:MFS transporter [Rickettsiaceae bacterium]
MQVLKQQILTREQKESIGLLQIGTFLEYFDLMLYVHMAVLLNELFFPETDPLTTRLIAALSFSSVFILRPFGAIIFGYIGDNFGRKLTVIITTTLMAVSCIIMYILPTYNDIGITASYIMILCRAMQGMSSMGEVIGAEIYLTETIKRPTIFPVVGFITVSLTLGGVASLAIASLATTEGFNWRYAFLIGTIIAMVGGLARTRLRETPDFVNAKKEIQSVFEKTGVDIKLLDKSPIYNEKANKITAIAYFLLECSAPTCFFLIYAYSANILKEVHDYTPGQIIHQNFIVTVIEFFTILLITFLSFRIYPLKILKVKLIIFACFIFILPFIFQYSTSPVGIMLAQLGIVFFGVNVLPAGPIFYSHFPIFKRFTYTGFAYALSRAIMHLTTSFGFIFLFEYLGHYGILVIMIPILIGFSFGLNHFEKLDKQNI